MNGTTHRRALATTGPRRGLARCALGAALIAVWWPIAWLQFRPLSDHYFFPLWLGYILAVDGILTLRTGTSPMTRSGIRVAWMFVASIPLWWTFELFNQIVGNWHYHLPRPYGPVAYALLASLAFSTVVPAVLTTCELVRSVNWDPLRRLPPIEAERRTLVALCTAGLAMVALIVAWPSYAFPLVWLALIFVFDPVASALGGKSIAWRLRRGDWSSVANLGVAALICGFFWEMWNVWALPKWTYEIPHADWLRVFEMPVLGYGGYIPFGVEVYIAYVLLGRLLPSAAFPEPRVSSRDVV
ncbi:MAG TPA: hypothetical protein VMM78_03275 [Thermomicrobiales bacterium]|nr:hypothetical protein [Thermomicrobiales bacterium]